MESKTTSKPAVTSVEAGEYIKNALITGELNMKDAVESLGWSFPRVRSKARTIAKKLEGTLLKKSRGIYYLETGSKSTEKV